MRKASALILICALFALPSGALASGACGDTDFKVARDNGTDPVSWGATDNSGNPSAVTVNVWWTPTSGSSINIATYPGSTIKTIAEGGTPIDLTGLNCSGASGTLNAKAVSAAGTESSVATKAYTFRVLAKPPSAPVLLP